LRVIFLHGHLIDRGIQLVELLILVGEPKILKPEPYTLNRLTNLPWDLSVLTNLKELDLSMNLYTQMPDQAHMLQKCPCSDFM
jgi:hypothetical protein